MPNFHNSMQRKEIKFFYFFGILSLTMPGFDWLCLAGNFCCKEYGKELWILKGRIFYSYLAFKICLRNRHS